MVAGEKRISGLSRACFAGDVELVKLPSGAQDADIVGELFGGGEEPAESGNGFGLVHGRIPVSVNWRKRRQNSARPRRVRAVKAARVR